MQFMSPRLRLAVALLAGLAGVGATAIWLSHARRSTLPHFSWAKAQGWDVQPVRVVRLTPAWLAHFESLPPRISPADAATVRACWGNSGGASGRQYYDENGSTVALRRLYEAAVAQYPNAFYPEHCLANWYAEHKNKPQYQYWEQRALHHAPAVLAGRVEFADGRPVPGARVQLILYAYEMGQGGSVQNIGWYPEATTDTEGCYYVPVFQGVYSMEGAGLYSGDSLTDSRGRHLNFLLTGGKTSDYPTSHFGKTMLGLGMVAVSHVGVLPKIIARPPIQIISPAGQPTNDEHHLALITNKVLDLAWKPVPGAVRYTVQIQEQKFGAYEAIMPDYPLFQHGSSVTHFQLPLDGTDGFNDKAPLFQHNQIYTLTIYAHSSTNPASVDDLVDSSGEFYFQPLSADAPLPLTKAAFAQAIGPGAVVTFIGVQGDEVTVYGSAPRETLNKLAGVRPDVGDFFGLQGQAGSYGPADARDRQQVRLTFRKL